MTADELGRDDIDASLRAAGAGVLSLTDGAETYAVPESFGYDGDRLYFQLVHDDDSRKMAFLDTTAVATFTVFTTDPARSVIVRGPVEPVPDEEADRAARALAGNAMIPDFNVSLDAATHDLQFDWYRLTPEERSGRAFGPPGASTGTTD